MTVATSVTAASCQQPTGGASTDFVSKNVYLTSIDDRAFAFNHFPATEGNMNMPRHMRAWGLVVFVSSVDLIGLHWRPGLARATNHSGSRRRNSNEPCGSSACVAASHLVSLAFRCRLEGRSRCLCCALSPLPAGRSHCRCPAACVCARLPARYERHRHRVGDSLRFLPLGALYV
jgi:hypothetical protein